MDIELWLVTIHLKKEFIFPYFITVRLGLFAIDEANDKPMDANDDGLLVNEQPTNNGGYLASLYLTADDACW